MNFPVTLEQCFPHHTCDFCPDIGDMQKHLVQSWTEVSQQQFKKEHKKESNAGVVKGADTG